MRLTARDAQLTVRTVRELCTAGDCDAARKPAAPPGDRPHRRGSISRTATSAVTTRSLHSPGRAYHPEAIFAAARRIPEAVMPRVDSETRQIPDYAFTAMPPSSDKLITLPMLTAALLETTNLTSMVLRTELANRGVDVEPALRSCREHLDTRASYADYLRSNHPYQPPERQVPPYAPDEPRTRRPPS